MFLVSMLREAGYHSAQENRITLHECSNLQFQSVTGPQQFHLVVGISYWTTFISPEVNTKCDL